MLGVAADGPGQLGSFRVAVEPDHVGPCLLCRHGTSKDVHDKEPLKGLNKEITKSDLYFRKSQEAV